MSVSDTLDRPETGPFAAALRRARAARRMSQLDLALTCDVSARHLSFLESGRARPSREMVLQLAHGLLLPLGSQNALLQAAGFAPVFPASPLDSAALGPFRAVLDEMIARHSPYPALLCDRHWTILDANPTARALLTPLHEGAGPMNVVRMLTDSPLAPVAIANYPEVLAEMTARIQLEALEAADDAVLRDQLEALQAVAILHPCRTSALQRRPLAPVVLRTPGQDLGFLSTIAQFGTSQDVTIRDLRLELLFPADDSTRAAMVAMGAALSGQSMPGSDGII
jgi:transcriptional regulator with XRE-family HTH domain